jgi:hypothetical protein
MEKRHDGRGPEDDRCAGGRQVMGSEHVDVVRESVAWLVGELTEAEVAAQIGAELGEVTAERVTHRNGYRARPWQTRAGEIELAIPKLRSGSYFPSFLEPRKRSEQALVAGRPGGLRQWRLHAQGRPPARAARRGRDGQGRRLAAVPRPG